MEREKVREFQVSGTLVLVTRFLERAKLFFFFFFLKYFSEAPRKKKVCLLYAGQGHRTSLSTEDKMSRHDKWLFIGLSFKTESPRGIEVKGKERSEINKSVRTKHNMCNGTPDSE